MVQIGQHSYTPAQLKACFLTGWGVFQYTALGCRPHDNTFTIMQIMKIIPSINPWLLFLHAYPLFYPWAGGCHAVAVWPE